MKFYKLDGSGDKFIDHFSNLSSGIHFSEILNYVDGYLSSKILQKQPNGQCFRQAFVEEISLIEFFDVWHLRILYAAYSPALRFDTRSLTS